MRFLVVGLFAGLVGMGVNQIAAQNTIHKIQIDSLNLQLESVKGQCESKGEGG